MKEKPGRVESARALGGKPVRAGEIDTPDAGTAEETASRPGAPYSYREFLAAKVVTTELLVERLLIRQFSMPGETVLDPFMGLGTVPYMAIKAGRVGLGVELSQRYFADAAAYCAAAAREASMPGLFDLVESEATA